MNSLQVVLLTIVMKKFNYLSTVLYLVHMRLFLKDEKVLQKLLVLAVDIEVVVQ